MTLAVEEVTHPQELRADFQQYYGLNLDSMGVEYSYAHAACLVTQLPPNARIFAAINPDLSLTYAEWLLTQIEYNLRVLAWQNSKDGQKGRNAPKLPKSPSEIAAEKERAAKVDFDLIEQVLGKRGGE